jgi:DNA-directed RNA polymerase specialized sigma subunit
MKNFERNAEIWRLYKENRMTLAAIGKMFNLSRQRVYQIVQAKKELVEHTKNWDKPFV